MPEAQAKKRGVMDRTQDWINKHIVPVMNKITATYWFSIIAESVLYIVPFTMVSAIPSLWNILRKFITTLPDLSVLNTYSFGLIGLFVVFIIPYKVLVKEERQDRALLAGFTGIGAYMLCMNAQVTDEGTVFTMAKFGAGGMFTAMFIGWFVGLMYKKTAHHSFFKDDSPIPDFVKNWFDNIIVIIVALLVGYLLTYVLSIDVFTLVGLLMSPLTGFAQTLPGVILIALIMDVFYFFGISGWVFTSFTSTVQQAALAENMTAAAAGLAPTNIYAFGFTRYTMIGGEGATLALALMLMFSKSKRNKLIGKTTLVPSLLNTNEPLFFSTIVNNPYMFIPVVLQAIILPANTWLWMHFGFASMHTEMFNMYFIPNFISATIYANGDLRNALLVIVNFILSFIIYFPFWKAYDNYLVKEEASQEASIAAKKEAKRAKRAAKRAAKAAAAESATDAPTASTATSPDASNADATDADATKAPDNPEE
ncbi:MAG: PTS sugar transporter subunit IIC [Tractidigestivibacter sp.]|jgi:PTS system cellobiose-specific IIC component|uniref:PTS sugar transporter subunit IIC n=1 Tax=Tractidigestivibacter sp. TaxID=2847320 RepID=UPI003D8AC324